jgi:hypothetical protein
MLGRAGTGRRQHEPPPGGARPQPERAGARQDSEGEWQDWLVDDTESQETSIADREELTGRKAVDADRRAEDAERAGARHPGRAPAEGQSDDAGGLVAANTASRASACGRSRCAPSRSCRRRLAKAFEAKYPGIAVRVERTGAERVFQRIGQEYSSNIHAVDVVNSSDAAHFIVWKRDGILAPYVPEDVGKFYSAEHKDVDGQFASWRVWLSHHRLQHRYGEGGDAPKSFADLLDPKWKGKIVKAHPGYSGTIMTATYQMQRDLGWTWFEQACQNRTSCRCNRRPIRRRSSISANARSWPTATSTIYSRSRRSRTPGRAGLRQRRLAADHRPQRHLQGLAASERGKAVPVVLLQPRCPAAHHRCRRAALGASADPGEAGAQALQGHQDHEGRRRRGGKRRRLDQGALYQDLPRLTRRSSRHHDIPTA